MKFNKYIAAGLFAMAGLTSCGDSYFDVDYTQNLDAESASQAAGENPAVFLNGAWSWLVTYSQTGSGSHDDFGYMSSLHATDMMGQDIAMGASHWFNYDYQHDNRMETYRRTRAHWTNYYTLIAKANEILGLYPEGGETADQKGLIGQAQTMRALAYLHLVQLYTHIIDASGNINSSAKGVPLMLSAADGYTEEELTAFKGRNTVADVLERIEKDLLAAVENLGAGYVRPNKNYIDKSVANGFLARYYLLTQNWQKAADAANAARFDADNNYEMMGFGNSDGIYDGFMDVTNSEWMWGFDHTTETQTTFASFFAMISNIAPGYAGLNYAPRLIDKALYDQIPEGDMRKEWFNGPDGGIGVPPGGNEADATDASKLPYASLKHGWDGNWTMDYLYMRAAEMVLIEAEAYAHMGQNAKAAQVLGELMLWRLLDSWEVTSVTVEDVYLQRRIELWGEGHAFYDLKRLNKGIDRSYEGNNHLAGYQIVVPAQDVRWTYQLPLAEMQENKQLDPKNDQNP